MASTKDRILDGSLELFNTKGIQAVTTNHIADHLKISTGNLYYHYRSKDHIIQALFERIDLAAREVMAPLPTPITPQQWAQVFVHGMNIVRRYRFFFANIVELAGRDKLLASQFRALTGWTLDWTIDAIDALIAQGSMRELAGDDRRRLAENVFIIIWNWTGFTVAFRGHELSHEGDTREGVLHSMLPLMPYFKPKFARDVRAAIDNAKVFGQERSFLAEP
ncbi:TetR family transcriptional regulator (plasmid) [Rhodococcus pyridinivorans SB3094]|uniref:TetR family transcriptional regulator n=1 Tax=Rhodococcus pyridinivorans SB3094 TaxID=1435356 RepID=V9XKP3_9NOCA|nr:TetR/AcrR family transcriptional regulator [Rhodococcus pyridinivorans]AHD24036.1 TetR family transcriptional regulator [Rhodococcus pyridinivorans SB3094]